MSGREVNLDTNADVSRDYEVVIMGAGLAGLMLARQLKLQIPDLKLALLEKKTQFDYWVGESTLAPWEDYARRVLKLERYIELNTIEKHGLRFFWDSADKDLSIVEMSEEGRSSKFPLFPSRQLDRSRFDQDLCDMVREMGVDVFLGTRILGRGNEWGDTVQIDGESGHKVHTDKGVFGARWLVDACGRQSPIARINDLVPPEPRHEVASYWARIENCVCIDDLAEKGWWKDRMLGVSRFISTSQFMYDGYWIWLIPVSDRIDSIGVTLKRPQCDRKIRNEEELIEFLKEHRCMQELLGDSYRVVDFYALSKIARCAKEFFSRDRWFLTGMSGWMVDPLFSVNCRIIAMNNTFIGHLIRADRDGKKDHYDAMAKHFNVAMRSAYQEVLEAVRHYDLHASFDFFHRWYWAMLANAFNRFYPKLHSDFEDFARVAIEHGTSCACGEKESVKKASLNETLGKLGEEFCGLLKKHGKTYENNRGKWADTVLGMGPDGRPGIWEKMMKRPDEDATAREDQLTYRYMFCSFLRRAAEIEGIEASEEALGEQVAPWQEERSLLEAVENLRRGA